MAATATYAFTEGKYLVTPSLRQSTSGGFISIVSVRCGQGGVIRDKIYTFKRQFGCQTEALSHVATEGRRLLGIDLAMA